MPRLEGTIEQIHYPLFDVVEFDHTTRSRVFFSRPQGQPLESSGFVKDNRMTNLTRAASLSGGERFEIAAVRLYLIPKEPLDPDANRIDLARLARATFGSSALRLMIQNKVYLDVPGMLAPGGVGIDERYAVSTEAAAATPLERYYGQNGVCDPRAIWVLAKTIRIEELETFRLEFFFGVDLADLDMQEGSSGAMCAVLDGILERPVQ